MTEYIFMVCSRCKSEGRSPEEYQVKIARTHVSDMPYVAFSRIDNWLDRFFDAHNGCISWDEILEQSIPFRLEFDSLDN